MRIRSSVGIVALVCAAVVSVGWAQPASTAPAEVAIYTRDKAPATPKLEDLPLKESVSQYGITWTFDKPSRVGQFVNGDYYVVGETIVKMIDPAPRLGKDVADGELDPQEQKIPAADRTRNGSTLNPPPLQKIGWDSGTHYHHFDPALTAHLPIAMKPGDCLASSISLKQGEKASFVFHSDSDRKTAMGSPAKVAAVLTCLAAPQPADAFRPGYADRKQKMYLARDLRRDLLPKLARAKDAPDPVKFAEVFQKAWLNPAYFSADQPVLNMPRYGQYIGQAVGDAGLLLCADYTPQEKERLLINFVQVGLDLWSLVKSGHPGWEGWGGHGSGRKLPIVVAGYLLGDDEMASPTKAFPKVNFGEDQQTRYGKAWTGAFVVFAGHSGILTATGQPPRPEWGPYEHLHPSKWDMIWTTKDGKEIKQANYQSECYRRANTSCCWVGEALTLRILGIEKQWNHDSFLDYVDRYMTEDDKAFCAVIGKEFGNADMLNPDKAWIHEGATGELWVKEMWEKDRAVSKAPTDGWKKDHGEEAAQFGPDPDALKPGPNQAKRQARIDALKNAGESSTKPAEAPRD
jgi:hypothetical protein